MLKAHIIPMVWRCLLVYQFLLEYFVLLIWTVMNAWSGLSFKFGHSASAMTPIRGLTLKPPIDNLISVLVVCCWVNLVEVWNYNLKLLLSWAVLYIKDQKQILDKVYIIATLIFSKLIRNYFVLSFSFKLFIKVCTLRNLKFGTYFIILWFSLMLIQYWLKSCFRLNCKSLVFD